jgi:hypothetical protein
MRSIAAKIQVLTRLKNNTTNQSRNAFMNVRGSPFFVDDLVKHKRMRRHMMGRLILLAFVKMRRVGSGVFWPPGCLRTFKRIR